MYGRDYAGKTLKFEPSGGLTNASLIMQDKQTDTYWSIMKGTAVAGALSGEKLKTLPVGEKVAWSEWEKRYPKTKVLSVRGSEDRSNGYGDYFTNEEGFRGLRASDKRMETKTPVFAFHFEGKAYAIQHADVVGGAKFTLKKDPKKHSEGNGEQVANACEVFLYRDAKDVVMRSTVAFRSVAGFRQVEGRWGLAKDNTEFDTTTREFGGPDVTPQPRVREETAISGFDTYWYNWSLNNPGTIVLQPTQANSLVLEQP